MLDKVFLQVLNMSFTAGIVIVLVLIARLFLKRLPKVFSYALWAVVLFRLICPFSFESMFSLLPTKVNPISQDIVYSAVPKVDTGIVAINHSINSLLPAAAPVASINPLQVWVFIGSSIWLLGILALFVYSVISLRRLQKQLKGAIHERDNIYFVEQLATPFVMGIIRPRIYLPMTLSNKEVEYILLHEQMHIKRFDHVIKVLSFFVLCLHWFNPLVWVAFFASAKDMEMSCDEAVIKQLGSDTKKEYSSLLLSLATGRKTVSGTPLAFGEGNTKGRIKNVLNYKKPAFWMVAATVIVVILLGAGLLTNPPNSTHLLDANDLNAAAPGEPKLLVGYMLIEDSTLYLDEVEIIEREDEARIAELGLNAATDLPSGYHIHNPVTEVVSFELTDDTRYSFTDYHLLYVKEADGNRFYTTTKKEEFLEGSSYQDAPLEEQRIPYFLEVHDGKVISITEEFIYTQ